VAKFPSTLLPQTNEPLEIQKAILDLLAKINENAGSSQALPPGTIQMYGGATAPSGFLLCDGATYRRVDYPALFAAIGAAFGAPDAATFKVPDFRGVSPTGPGAQSINGRTKTGPNLGEVREDQGQGHLHPQAIDTGGGVNVDEHVATNATGPSVTGAYNSASVASATRNQVLTYAPITDGTNGDPRTGAYTHGPEIGVHFIIKT